MPIPSFLKQAATPGSTGFLIVCVVVWLALRYVWPRNRPVDRGWLLVIVSVYLVLGLPLVANAIADRLPDGQWETTRARSVETLVVFDGDNRLGRVERARRVYDDARPEVVQVLGQTWFVDALAAAGIPPKRIVQDAAPSTTRAQMAWVEHRLAGTRPRRVGVIASRLQMPRIAALAKAAGLPLVLIASPVDDEPPRSGIRLLLPTYIALRVSRDALYEHAALRYYAWRGWIQPA